MDAAGAPEDTLRGLRLLLPPPRPADRAALQRVGNLLYTSGMLPRWGEELRHRGAVDAELSTRQAAAAARLCAHNIVAVVRQELGSLDRVVQVVEITVMVHRSVGFDNLSRVADGASRAMFEIFGDRGRHRREVIGGDVAENAPVQVAAVLRVA
jgi:enamine deaminase RidA (YjgF/YER057c/UK114 family)